MTYSRTWSRKGYAELRQQLTETTEANAEPVLANVKRQRQLGRVFGDLELAAPVPAARNMKHNCCHHWIIEVAIGPLSKGVCKLCGEEQLFRNQLRWAEIAPVRVMRGRRQENDNTKTLDQREDPAFVLAGSRYGSSTPLQSAGRGY
jgi:hypothetical protein